MSSIRIHPEFGVNPSLDLCYWCGEAHGVVLLGYNKNQEAPRQMVTSYVPCQKCQDGWAQGVALISVTTRPNSDNQPPINPQAPNERTMGHIDLYPTGRMVVITKEATLRIFTEECANDLIKKGRGFIGSEEFEQIFGAEIKRMNPQ